MPEMRQIIYVGVAAEGVAAGQEIVMEPGQVKKFEVGVFSPQGEFGWSNKAAVAVGPLFDHPQKIFRPQNGKEK